ncbi:hypothetical protein D3C86_1801630 [compost metagenome]
MRPDILLHTGDINTPYFHVHRHRLGRTVGLPAFVELNAGPCRQIGVTGGVNEHFAENFGDSRFVNHLDGFDSPVSYSRFSKHCMV